MLRFARIWAALGRCGVAEDHGHREGERRVLLLDQGLRVRGRGGDPELVGHYLGAGSVVVVVGGRLARLGLGRSRDGPQCE